MAFTEVAAAQTGCQFLFFTLAVVHVLSRYQTAVNLPLRIEHPTKLGECTAEIAFDLRVPMEVGQTGVQIQSALSAAFEHPAVTQVSAKADVFARVK